MESLRSLHARVAALARYRPQDDPEVVAARNLLAQRVEQARTVRTGIGELPPTSWQDLLTTPEVAAHV